MPGEDTRVWSLAVRDGRIEPELVYASDGSGTSRKLPPLHLRDALKYEGKKRDLSASHSHFFSSTARSGRVKITVKRPRAAVPAALVDDLTSLLTFVDRRTLGSHHTLTGCLVLKTDFLWAKVRFEGVPMSESLQEWAARLGAVVTFDPTFDEPIPSEGKYTREFLSDWCAKLADIEDALRKDDFTPEFVEPSRCETKKKLAEAFLNDVRPGPTYRQDLCGFAARHGALFSLAFGRHQGFTLKEMEATRWAAMFGEPATLRFCVRAIGSPTDIRVCRGAALAGSVECLEFLRSSDPPAPWDATVCAAAGQYGRLDVLKWLRSTDREDKCPWDERTTALAEINGHLRLLEWAWVNGCDYKPRSRPDLPDHIRGRLAEFKKRVRESRSQTHEPPRKRVKTEPGVKAGPAVADVKTEHGPNAGPAETTDSIVTNADRSPVRKFFLRLHCGLKKVSVPDRIDDPNFFTRVVDFIGEFTDEQNDCFHRAMRYESELVFDYSNDDKKTYLERFKKVIQRHRAAEQHAEQLYKQVEDILKAYDDPLPVQFTGESVVTEEERRAAQRWIQDVSGKARRIVLRGPFARALAQPIDVSQDSQSAEYMLYRLSQDKKAYCDNLEIFRRREKETVTAWLTENARKRKVLRDVIENSVAV